MNRAVFLDRDGTINEEVGYLTDLDKLKLIPGAGDAIKKLNESGLKVVVVTNQSGVARGHFTEFFVHKAHALLEALLRNEGAHLDGIYYCPHHPKAGNSHYTTACDCRKPGTGLIDKAAQDFDIDIKKSYMVGDKWSDIELGQRAGTHTLLVKTGFAHDDSGNVRSSHVHEPDFIALDITEAVEWIVRHAARDRQ